MRSHGVECMRSHGVEWLIYRLVVEDLVLDMVDCFTVPPEPTPPFDIPSSDPLVALEKPRIPCQEATFTFIPKLKLGQSTLRETDRQALLVQQAPRFEIVCTDIDGSELSRWVFTRAESPVYTRLTAEGNVRVNGRYRLT